MPDFSGGRDGKLAIIFCSAGDGTCALVLGLARLPEQPSSDEQLENLFTLRSKRCGLVHYQAGTGGDAHPIIFV